MTTKIMTDEEQLIAAYRLTRDLRTAASTLDVEQARYMVDLYYGLQKMRIGADAQVRSATDEPNSLISWSARMYEKLETDVQAALGVYAKSQVVGRWSLSQPGIGPVIAAGLLAHIDIKQAPTAGHIWRYAGLDPTVKWEKKTKRPWNARLKVICWKAGQSFVKVSGKPDSLYGRLYRERKAWELLQNNMEEIPGSDPKKYRPIIADTPGTYAMQARSILEGKNFRGDTETKKWYSLGILPPAQIQARAERYAVKIFLSHYHAVAYEVEYGKPAPTPWVIQFGGHVDVLSVPGWPLPEPCK